VKFRKAVERTPNLEGAWRAGLGALRAEDKPHIRAENPRQLTGSDNQIKVVLRKLEWLKAWLRQDAEHLDKFDREFVWVSSGHTFFTKGSAQVKELAQKGLLYAGAVLRIPTEKR
jgi:hypothetical protein